MGDRCSHADFSLSEGEIWPEECEIECWKHGSTFSLVTGEPQSLPAIQPVPVYKVRVVDGDVLVELSMSRGDDRVERVRPRPDVTLGSIQMVS